LLIGRQNTTYISKQTCYIKYSEKCLERSLRG